PDEGCVADGNIFYKMFVAGRDNVIYRVVSVVIGYQRRIFFTKCLGQWPQRGDIQPEPFGFPLAFNNVLVTDIPERTIDAVLIEYVHSHDHRESNANGEAKDVNEGKQLVF